MASIYWQKSFETGIDEIDQQHRQLVEMIAQLEESLKRGAVNDEVGNVIVGLVDYVKIHFAFEEQFMQQICYPRYEPHRSEHVLLTKQIVEMLLKLKRRERISVFELLFFLRGWLFDHIVKEDKLIGQAVIDHGLNVPTPLSQP
jgi:hemerythrin